MASLSFNLILLGLILTSRAAFPKVKNIKVMQENIDYIADPNASTNTDYVRFTFDIEFD